MAAGSPYPLGPVALSATTTTNIMNPPTITGGVGSAALTNTRITLYRLHIANKHATIAAKSLGSKM